MNTTDPYADICQPSRPKIHGITWVLVGVHLIISAIFLIGLYRSNHASPYAWGWATGRLLFPFFMYLSVTGLIWVLSGRSLLPNTLLCGCIILSWVSGMRAPAAAHAWSKPDPAVAAELARQEDSLMRGLGWQCLRGSSCKPDEAGLNRYREAAAKAGVSSKPFEAQYHASAVVMSELKAQTEASVSAWGNFILEGGHLASTIGSKQQLDERIEQAQGAVKRFQEFQLYLEDLKTRLATLLQNNGMPRDAAPPYAEAMCQAMDTDSRIRIAVGRRRVATTAAEALSLLSKHWGRWSCDPKTKELTSADVPDLPAKYKAVCLKYDARMAELQEEYCRSRGKSPAKGQSTNPRGNTAAAGRPSSDSP